MIWWVGVGVWLLWSWGSAWAASVTLQWTAPVWPVGYTQLGYQVQRCQVPLGQTTCVPVDLPGARVVSPAVAYTDVAAPENAVLLWGVVSVGVNAKGVTERSLVSNLVQTSSVLLAPPAQLQVTLVFPSARLSGLVADSTQPAYPVALAVDGLLTTFWHSQYVGTPVPLPHSLTLDLGAPWTVVGLRYTPRQDGDLSGTIAQYRVDGSLDASTWVALASGTWPATAAVKTVRWVSRAMRYLRLVALTEVEGRSWSSAAEVGVLLATQ